MNVLLVCGKPVGLPTVRSGAGRHPRLPSPSKKKKTKPPLRIFHPSAARPSSCLVDPSLSDPASRQVWLCRDQPFASNFTVSRFLTQSSRPRRQHQRSDDHLEQRSPGHPEIVQGFDGGGSRLPLHGRRRRQTNRLRRAYLRNLEGRYPEGNWIPGKSFLWRLVKKFLLGSRHFARRLSAKLHAKFSRAASE